VASTDESGGILATFRYGDRDDVVVAITHECANGVPVEPNNHFDLIGDIQTFTVDRL